ncbi:MAG: 16S rRNA (guanine(966)-N(2))-methyltransferase RsmD [Marinilabiliales bacterium]|nr:MAG: 16S rRNA (guanine(966)-N(2))-methyltransferase RsmD [Marinilabiliales bacterium]
MRIISGSLRGRTFYPPTNAGMRPTTDMAREALFNILPALIDFEGKVVLDLFSGSGGMALEFISRGVEYVYAVEKKAQLAKFIKDTAEKFNVDNLKVIQQDAYKLLLSYNIPTDIVFADPPYDMPGIDDLPDMIYKKRAIINEGGLFILEHNSAHNYSDHERFMQSRKYGKVHFTIFQ